MNNELIKDYIDGFPITAFQDDLIGWFKKEKRDLPWRKDQDPYKIWVSEIMLQQTKVDTVIPYFESFLEKFPTMQDLAQADEQTVLKAWEGLGYYSRARNLQTAVREVVENYDSTVPDNAEELGTLKGVGPYTTGAILSIAYSVPEPAVDGNVMRVLSRILLMDLDIAKPRTRKIVEAIVNELISDDDPSSFNQGLMELGALICTPKSPSCMLCPVQAHCQAFQLGVEEQLPVKSKAKKPKELPYFSFVITDKKGRYLIEKRPSDGLLADMWQFPMVSKTEVDLAQAVEYFDKVKGIPISVGEKVDYIKHVFSHVVWHMDVYVAEVIGDVPPAYEGSFVEKDELLGFPFPVSHQKIRKHVID